MENLEIYKHLNNNLKEKFGERTLKLCIDGNFTCPNRDGFKSFNGCIFCSNKGSGDHLYTNKSTSSSIENDVLHIKSQVENYFKTYRASRANKFIVYFQNFTNTYDSIENLKRKYDAALIDSRIVGIQIATRPDCINEEIAKLLSSYKDKYYVCVELGLQTYNDETGKFINRQYSSLDFSNAVNILNKYNINVVAHIMIGLPNETHEDLENTIDFLNKHSIQGLKIHNVYVVKNTKLEDLYLNKAYTPIDFETYLNELCFVLTHISPEIVIHRISGDAPKDLLIAPEWNIHKKWILNGIEKKLKEENLYQGIYYKTAK